MAEQSTKENIRNTTLYTLVRHVGLTPQEVAQLRLADLHLAGKRPNISFTPAGRDEPKIVDLDLSAHRALVGWLVARPDSSSDFLFPGQGTEAMSWQEINQLVVEAEEAQTSVVEEKSTEPDDQSTPSEAEPPAVSETPPSGARSMPPPSTPELGTPPPGLAGTRAPTFQPPPPTAPEEEPVNIPLPTSGPKPPSPPEPVSAPDSQPGKAPPVGAPVPIPMVAKKKTAQTGSPGARAEGPVEKKAVPPPRPKKMGKLKAQQAAAKKSKRLSRVLVPVMVIVLILLCVGCGSGAWLIWQSETSNELLARLGLVDTSADIFPDERDIIASLTPPTTPLPTPTLPPTSTPTLLPLTNTPVPTETSTPVPTDTPLPPTDTPAPVDTPAPTDTPIPADTPVPVESPTPTETPTPAMKYDAPVLLEPEDETLFNEGNMIVLRWQSVGELAPDEQYAVRLVYQFENQTTFQGTNIRETEWTVPSSLFGQVDGPDYLYEWFVVVERLNDDGSGTAISPESERRTFVWK